MTLRLIPLYFAIRKTLDRPSDSAINAALNPAILLSVFAFLTVATLGNSQLFGQRSSSHFGNRSRSAITRVAKKPIEIYRQEPASDRLTLIPPQEVDRPQFEENLPELDTQDPSLPGSKTEDQLGTTWPARSISQIRIDIRESGSRVPEDRSAELAGFGAPTSRPTSQKVFAWAAPNLRYQPLYFEDVALERYGQTLPGYQQSFASGLHFFKSFVFLPNQMRHDHPSSCDYPLGFCRPGNTIPYTIQRSYFGRPQ